MPSNEYWTSQAATLRELGRGRKTAHAKAQADACQIGLQTWWRNVKNIGGYDTARKVRADCGESVLSEEEVRLVSSYMWMHNRKNNKQILSLPSAVERLQANGKINPQVSVSTVQRQLAMRSITPKKMLIDRPVQATRTEYSNQLHQVDPSVSTLFKFGKDAHFDWDSSAHYKNKPDNLREALSRELIWRYVLTDHASGFIRVRYILAAGESWANYIEALTWFWAESKDLPFFGVPRYLMADRVGAMNTSEINSLLQNLEVTKLTAQSARAKGQVEGANNIVECSFESSLKGQTVRDINHMNELAASWERWYNAKKVHSRHGMTRSACWLKYAKQEHLRYLPDASVIKYLVESRGVERTVDPEKSIRFDNKTYRLRHLTDINIKDVLVVRPAPYSPGDIFVTVKHLNGTEAKYQVSPIEKDALGFAADAALVGEEHVKQMPDTPRDVMKKEALKQAYDTDKLEDAEKAKDANKPIYQDTIDPLAHIKQAELPTYMPRRGNEIVKAPELPRMSALQSLTALSNALDRPLTTEEGAEVRRLYPEGCTDADIKAIAARWQQQNGARPKLSLVK